MENPPAYRYCMTIQKKHLYHGCALAQIAEHRGFTSLHVEKSVDRASDTYGHYRVNRATHLFIKYRSKGEHAYTWNFKFQAQEVKRIRRYAREASRCLLALVCAPHEICLLEMTGLEQRISLRILTQEQSVTSRLSPDCSFSLQGHKGQLLNTTRRKRFPEALFCHVTT